MSENDLEQAGEKNSNLTEYFHRELLKNITELNAIIALEQGKRLSKKSFIQAGVIIEDIHDLSMIHGFDSIEAIAEKLAATAVPLNNLSPDSAATALANIQAGIRAILDILKISGDLAKTSPTNPPVPQISQPDITENAGDAFFDIKEIDSLMQLVDEQPESALTLPTGTENAGLAQAFDEVFREEALEALHQFQTALANLKNGVTPENLLRLKSGIFALRDAAQSYKVPALVEPLTEFIRFCDSELKTGGPVSSGLLQRLETAEKMLHAFVADYPAPGFEPLRLLQLFQPGTGGFKPPADSSESVAESSNPQLQIKAKISVTKEEIRRRWILKKH